MAAVAAVAAGLAMVDDLRDSVIVVARHRDGGHAGNGPAVASPPGDQEVDLLDRFGRPPVDQTTVALIERMARENGCASRAAA